jgi:glutathione S-transferase
MGEVPVLEHGGKRLSQSGVILHYLADHFAKFGGSSPDEKREILRWMLWEPQVHDFLRGRVKTSLGILDTHLSKNEFVIGQKPTIADLSLCGYLYWPDEFGFSWSDYPRIGAWLDRIRALPGWVHPYELMPGHPLKR